MFDVHLVASCVHEATDFCRRHGLMSRAVAGVIAGVLLFVSVPNADTTSANHCEDCGTASPAQCQSAQEALADNSAAAAMVATDGQVGQCIAPWNDSLPTLIWAVSVDKPPQGV